MSVEIGAHLQQCFESDFHENVISGPIAHAPKELDYDQRETENQNSFGAIERWSV